MRSLEWYINFSGHVKLPSQIEKNGRYVHYLSWPSILKLFHCFVNGTAKYKKCLWFPDLIRRNAFYSFSYCPHSWEVNVVQIGCKGCLKMV